MMHACKRLGSLLFAILCFTAVLPTITRSQNQVMGAIHFVTEKKAEKSSGVWIDGQYVGYVSQLKGHNKVSLLPGTHDILVRQSGFTDFRQKVDVQPGQTVELTVAMQRDPSVQYSKVTSQIKLDVMPEGAGVFLDGAFVGYVHQFGGVGRAMLVSPGKHQIKIVNPGFQDFTTDVDLLPHQEFKISTMLVPGKSAEAAAPPKAE